MLPHERSFINQFWNPMDIIAKVVQAIFAVITTILYEQKATFPPTIRTSKEPSSSSS